METVHSRTHVEALFMLLATLSLSTKKASRETEPEGHEESSEAANGDSEATMTHNRQKNSVTGKPPLFKSEFS
jgi:hypothetical protein